MKNFCKKLRAFTMAEIAISLMVLAIIASATIVSIKPRSTYYSNKFMYYSTFNNLQQGVYDLLAQGTLPTVGHNTNTPPTGLCDRLSDLFNTIPVSESAAVDCSKTANDSGPFTVDNANFITTNGIRFFNFGSDVNGTAPNQFFTVYADIDGPRRNAELNQDVFMFNIYTANGLLLPDISSPGANNTDYLSVSVKYLNTTTGNYVWLLNGGTYRQAVCMANRAQQFDANYCASLDPEFQANTNCSTFVCQIIINKPRVSFVN